MDRRPLELRRVVFTFESEGPIEGGEAAEISYQLHVRERVASCQVDVRFEQEFRYADWDSRTW